jgi:dephospho-CoA kinase
MGNRIFQVGITGGIGAGKSLVCHIFSQLGVPVYHADEKAKWLMDHHVDLRQKIIENFGPKSYDPQLNRRYLAQHVFRNREKLELLNSLVHPVVHEDYKLWASTVEYPFCIKEAALLFETGSYKELNFNILVYASVPIRIQRILKRDPFRSKEEIMDIIDKQMGEDRKKELADYVVENDGKTMILPVILELHNMLITKSPSHSV